MDLRELAFAQAASLAGELEERQEALLRLLCAAAVTQLEGRLKEGLTAESCKTDFAAAAALYALADLGQCQSEGIREFRAGDLTVKKGGGGTASRCLRQQAERMIGPYLEDGGFVFLGV